MPVVAYPAALLLVAAALTVPLTARTAAAGGDLGFAVVDLVQGACYLAVGVLLIVLAMFVPAHPELAPGLHPAPMSGM